MRARIRKYPLAPLLFALALLSACVGSDSPEIRRLTEFHFLVATIAANEPKGHIYGSCNDASANRCTDCLKDFTTDVCSFFVCQSGETFSESACSEANRVGSCDMDRTIIRYYSPTFDAASAQNNCSSGTFTAD